MSSCWIFFFFGANLREKDTRHRQRQMLSDSAEVWKGQDCQEDVTAFTAERAAFGDEERLPKCIDIALSKTKF